MTQYSKAEGRIHPCELWRPFRTFKDGKAAGDPVTKLGKMRASLRGHLERCGAAMASAEIDRRLDELAATLQKSWGVDLGY